MAAAAMVGLLSMGESASVKAQGDACADLTNPVYIAGASAVERFVREAQRSLNEADEEITLVYQQLGSCSGPPLLIDGEPTTQAANYYTFDASGAPSTTACTLPTAGVVPDISVADVTAAACAQNLGVEDGYTLTTSHRQLPGAIQAMAFAVGVSSSEQSISAEAARVVFGFGGEDQDALVAPWTQQAHIHNRPGTSGTQITAAAVIGLPSTLWAGTETSSSGTLRQNLVTSASTAANAAIGIVSVAHSEQETDGQRTLRPLAFQAQGESCAYLPNSSATSLDKANVRSGLYEIFGPMQFIVNVNGSGQIIPSDGRTDTTAAVRRVVDLLTFNDLSEDETKVMIETAVASSTIPVCAMKASRADEYSKPVPFSPAEPCHCFYESLVGAESDSCSECTDDSTCGTGKCRFGFCEEK